jgi:hypothetical protein
VLVREYDALRLEHNDVIVRLGQVPPPPPSLTSAVGRRRRIRARLASAAAPTRAAAAGSVLPLAAAVSSRSVTARGRVANAARGGGTAPSSF